jgi:glycosyltransferase involved in cell wall biosynthesis
MVILTTLYNAGPYIEQCIGSIMSQSFKDFKCYITDDLSTDNSVQLVEDLIKDDDRFVLIKNTVKLYQPGNYDQVIRNNKLIDDNEVCVEIDGDDWLPDSKVLDRINATYQDDNTWIATGSFRYSNGGIGFSSRQDNFNNLRSSTFTASHIRTWRAFLWRNIQIEDLKDQNGYYWKVAGDLAFMYPMLEMAGENRYKFMLDVNYVYNESNPLNDHKVNILSVNEIVVKIRNKKPYNKLTWMN